MLDPDDMHTGNYDSDIVCRLCKLKGTEETPYHLDAKCMGAWQQRRELLGCYSYKRESPMPWEPDSLLQFFKHFDLESGENTS